MALKLDGEIRYVLFGRLSTCCIFAYTLCVQYTQFCLWFPLNLCMTLCMHTFPRYCHRACYPLNYSPIQILVVACLYTFVDWTRTTATSSLRAFPSNSPRYIVVLKTVLSPERISSRLNHFFSFKCFYACATWWLWLARVAQVAKLSSVPAFDHQHICTHHQASRAKTPESIFDEECVIEQSHMLFAVVLLKK